MTPFLNILVVVDWRQMYKELQLIKTLLSKTWLKFGEEIGTCNLPTLKMQDADRTLWWEQCSIML